MTSSNRTAATQERAPIEIIVPARERGLRAPRAAHHRRWRRLRWWLIWLVVSSPFLYFIARATYPSVTVEVPGFISQQQVIVRAPVGGSVAEVYAQPMQDVMKGEPLARLENAALSVRADQLQAELKGLGNAAAGASGGESSTAYTRGELIRLQQQLDALVIRAPESGRIVDLSVTHGDPLAAGGKVAMLAPPDGELRISVYIPEKYAEFAKTGKWAKVLFPDGSRHTAEIIDVTGSGPGSARRASADRGAAFGGASPVLLALMKFVDDEGSISSAVMDGLPVKVRFKSRWSPQLPALLTTGIRRYWDQVRGLANKES